MKTEMAGWIFLWISLMVIFSAWSIVWNNTEYLMPFLILLEVPFVAGIIDRNPRRGG